MATFRERPYARNNFLVDLGTGDPASAQAGFVEVILPDARIDAIDYRAGNEKTSEPRKVPGAVGYGNVVLKRGVLGSLDLYQWWSQVRSGDAGAARTITIHLLSEDRQTTALTWRLRNAWPVRYGFEPLSTVECSPAMEVIELSFEGLELE